MKKLFFALITSFLFVATAWGLNVNTSEVTLKSGQSKSYPVNEDGYTTITIRIKKSSGLANNNNITVNIKNKYGDRIGIKYGATTDWGTYTFSSISGESIREVEIKNETSLYKVTFSTITLTKSATVLPEYCSIKRIETEKEFYSHKGNYVQYDFNDVSTIYSKNLIFSARCEQGSTIANNNDMVVQVHCSDDADGVYRELTYYGLSGWNAKSAGIIKDFVRYSVEIPRNVTSVRFITIADNNTLRRYVKNVEIYRDNILNPNTNQINFESKVGDSQTKEFNLEYSNINQLSATISGEHANNFSINYNPAEECAEGTQTIKVTFTPSSSCINNYNATITLFNGQYQYITLNGTRTTNPGTVKEITWTGEVDTNWDNRANWKKADGVLSVADVLDTELKVNIPAGLAQYPVIPDVSTDQKFKTDRDKACDCAQVNAGDNATATMIADKIYMESGAAIVGVETLGSRYGEVQIDFTPVRCYENEEGKLRYDWSLVGPVVKPWDDANPGETRNVVSGDYYKNDLPHVYMHEAVMIKDGEDYIQTWDNSFASLTVKIPHDKAFAIRMPNQYGRNSSGNGIPAIVYNRKNGTNYDHRENIKFTFTGRFYNENALPKYTGLTPEQPVLLNNTYPANIDADKLQSMCNGSIQIYEGHSFSYVGGRKDAIIPSHYGFIFTPGKGVTELTIPRECFQTTKVENNRSAETEVQSLKLQLKNEESDVYSIVYISEDELKDDAANYFVDAPKLFNDMESNLADLYVMRYDSKWAGLTVPTVEESLPLGIKVRTANQKHRFNLLDSNLDYDIILEDRQEAKEYNLSAGEVCEVSDLAVGDCRGRFYLKTTESADTPTDIVEEDEEISSIDIYANGNSITVSSDDNIRNIIVSDLSGRQMNYNVNGQYIVLDMPVSSGIYTVNVIGDNTSKIAKVKLN